MSFYGILISTTSIVSLAFLFGVLHSASAPNALGAQFNEYSNIQEVEAFQGMISLTNGYITTPQQYDNWLSAIGSSAQADGVYVRIYNKTIIIGINRTPGVYSVITVITVNGG